MLVTEGHNLTEAIRELHLAVELQPQMMVAHLQLAAVHTQLEEHEMAAACLTRCIEQAGDDPRKLCVRCQRCVFSHPIKPHVSCTLLSCVALWRTVNVGLRILGQTHHSCVQLSPITLLLYGTILGWTRHGAVVALLTDCLVEHSARLETMLEPPS
jgi:hypothetical protein